MNSSYILYSLEQYLFATRCRLYSDQFVTNTQSKSVNNGYNWMNLCSLL